MCSNHVKMYERVTLLCDVRSYSGPDWSTSLFDTSNKFYFTCTFFDIQRHKRRSIEILVETDSTEQMNNETAQ